LSRDTTEAEIQRVRESGILGRSDVLSRLFDFLALRAFDERPPKEAEIAIEVFGRSAIDGANQDTAVRVYVHRLRRKLEEHYLRNPDGGRVRLVLPKGEYRLMGVTAGPLRARWFRPNRNWVIAGLASVFVALNLVAWLLLFGAAADGQTAEARRAPLWTSLKHSPAPLLIVVGDYYLVGEKGDDREIQRLVREFSVGSKQELAAYQLANPETADRYVDIGLSYLPVSSAAAIQRVSRVLPRGEDPKVITASEFTREMFKSNDVVFIGHLSGLGPLRDAVFSASRVQFGETYDEIIDTVSGRRFESQAGAGAVSGEMYADYGYLSSIEGPSGNRIIVIAGTRDASALGLSEIATQPDFLRALREQVDKASSFEALYRVQGAGQVNFEAELIFASPLDAKRIWTTPGV